MILFLKFQFLNVTLFHCLYRVALSLELQDPYYQIWLEERQ